MSLPSTPVPGVSIIIPCYNYGHYLRDAIDSCLRQTYQNIEVLVIDDGSSDDSAAIASSYGPPVRCITQVNQGLGATRNNGITLAAHNLVVFLDADDRLEPDAIKFFLEGYSSNLRPAIVAGCTQGMDADGNMLGQLTHPARFNGMRRIELADTLMTSPFSPIVLAERGFLLALGGFETDDHRFRGSEDRDLWIRAAASDRAVCLVGSVVATYRVHQASMSHNGMRQLASSQAVLARAQHRYSNLVPASVWNKAWAFSWFQVSVMHLGEGRPKDAALALGRSFWLAPVISNPVLANLYGRLFRLRRLLVLAKQMSIMAFRAGMHAVAADRS